MTHYDDGAPAPRKGTRVQLHAATSYWMQGDRYGTVVGHGRKREYVTNGDKHIMASPVLVQLDKSGRTVRLHPDNVFALEDSE